jgi:hypothetical protein
VRVGVATVPMDQASAPFSGSCAPTGGIKDTVMSSKPSALGEKVQAEMWQQFKDTITRSLSRIGFCRNSIIDLDISEWILWCRPNLLHWGRKYRLRCGNNSKIPYHRGVDKFFHQNIYLQTDSLLIDFWHHLFCHSISHRHKHLIHSISHRHKHLIQSFNQSQT